MPHTVFSRMKYCVYTHSATGKVFYVGCGDLTRPFDIVRRSHTWKEYVSRLKSYDVTVVLWTNDREEARREEIRLILELSPLCNVKKYRPKEIKDRFMKTHSGKTHFVSVRMPEDLWIKLERIAARETIAMNSLINGMLDLALDLEDSPTGQEQIHEACTLWRSRYEHKVTRRRKQRLPE